MSTKLYECSSRGDKRYSAFYATINGESIEYHYQVHIKGYASIKEGKGKIGKKYSYKIQRQKYKELWKKYFIYNPEIYDFIYNKVKIEGYTLNDMFARGNATNQATIITELIEELGGLK